MLIIFKRTFWALVAILKDEFQKCSEPGLNGPSQWPRPQVGSEFMGQIRRESPWTLKLGPLAGRGDLGVALRLGIF